jgi:hypothetical protein
LRKAATRASMIENTANLALYVRQFGGAVAVIPDEGAEQLALIAEFV